MKRFIGSLTLMLLGFLIALAILLYLLGVDPRAWLASLTDPGPPERVGLGKMVAANGQVESRFTEEGTWARISDGDEVAGYDEIRTGPASFAGTSMRIDATLVLSEFSHAKLSAPADDLGRVKAVRVGCIAGAMRSELSASMQAAVIYDLAAGWGVKQEKGGRFVLLEGPNAESLVSIMGSAAKVADAETALDVPADHGVVIDATGKAGGVVRLPPPPTPAVDELKIYAGDKSEAIPIFRFKDKGSQIRIIVARDETLLDVIAEATGDAAEVTLESLPIGTYFYAAAIQEPTSGLMGVLTPAIPFTVVEGDSPSGRDEYPTGRIVFSQRASGSVFYTRGMPSVGIDWPGKTTSKDFSFVLARDKDLTQPVKRSATKASRYTARNLPAGRYWWQARSSDGRRRYNGRFFVRNVKGFIPRIQAVNQVDEKFRSAAVVYQRNAPDILFKWKRDGRASTYKLLVSRRDDFTQPVATREVSSNSAKLPSGTLTDGRYKWRVERITDSGDILYEGKVRELVFRFDNDVPSLEIASPADGAPITSNVKVAGLSARDVDLTVNGKKVLIDSEGRFSDTVPMSRKDPRLVFRAVKSGRLSYYVRELTP